MGLCSVLLLKHWCIDANWCVRDGWIIATVSWALWWRITCSFKGPKNLVFQLLAHTLLLTLGFIDALDLCLALAVNCFCSPLRLHTKWNKVSLRAPPCTSSRSRFATVVAFVRIWHSKTKFWAWCSRESELTSSQVCHHRHFMVIHENSLGHIVVANVVHNPRPKSVDVKVRVEETVQAKKNSLKIQRPKARG
jgi:hypothetical protein